MSAPQDLRFLQTHEWHRLEGDTVTIGISQFAADELTDITFVDLKTKVGDTLAANQRFGEIESVKATSDLYTGVAGTVTAVNTELANDAGLVNREPYQGGWMIKLKVNNPADVNQLLSADEYVQKTGQEPRRGRPSRVRVRVRVRVRRQPRRRSFSPVRRSRRLVRRSVSPAR